MPRPRTGQIIRGDGKRGRTFAVRTWYRGRREYVHLGYEDDGMDLAGAEEERDHILRAMDAGTWVPPRVLEEEGALLQADGLMPKLDVASGLLRRLAEVLIDAEQHPLADAERLAVVREQVYDVEDSLGLARARMHPLYQGQPA